MIDIINILNILNVILNTISTSFTLLFILYRFTSLFSYMLGFIKFCAKIIKGIFYIKNNISYYSSGYCYTTLSNDDNNSKSIFSKIGNYVNRTYRYFFPKKKEYTILPVYEIRESYIDQNNENNQNDNNNTNDIEKNLINAQLNDLMNDDYNDDESAPFINENENSFNLSKTSSNYLNNKSLLYKTGDFDLLDDNRNNNSIMLQDIYYDCDDNYNETLIKKNNEKLLASNTKFNLESSNMFLNFDFIKKNIENKREDDEIINKFQNLSL